MSLVLIIQGAQVIVYIVFSIIFAYLLYKSSVKDTNKNAELLYNRAWNIRNSFDTKDAADKHRASRGCSGHLFFKCKVERALADGEKKMKGSGYSDIKQFDNTVIRLLHSVRLDYDFLEYMNLLKSFLMYLDKRASKKDRDFALSYMFMSDYEKVFWYYYCEAGENDLTNGEKNYAPDKKFVQLLRKSIDFSDVERDIVYSYRHRVSKRNK